MVTVVVGGSTCCGVAKTLRSLHTFRLLLYPIRITVSQVPRLILARKDDGVAIVIIDFSRRVALPVIHMVVNAGPLQQTGENGGIRRRGGEGRCRP